MSNRCGRIFIVSEDQRNLYRKVQDKEDTIQSNVLPNAIGNPHFKVYTTMLDITVATEHYRYSVSGFIGLE